jgi:hypothetical protein
MNYKNKMFYLGLNLLAPGIGQIALRWYFRGILELLIAIAAIVWMVAEIFVPILNFMTGDNMTGAFPNINLQKILFALGIIVLVWLWSLVEIILFYTPPKPAQEIQGSNDKA